MGVRGKPGGFPRLKEEGGPWGKHGFPHETELKARDGHAPATVTSVNDVTVAPASASAWATVFAGSWIHV